MTLKNRLLTLAISLCSVTSYAQTNTSSPFVSPQFINGTVLQKGGGVVQASLDYNTVTQEMMFEKDGGKLILDQTDNIDTIFMDQRKFIPAKKGFYEKLANGKTSLFVEYKSTIVNSGAPIGANGGNNSNAIGGFIGVKQMKGSSKTDPYALQLPSGYNVRTENFFWLEKDKQFYPATDLKKIAKLFPSKANDIEAYVKQNGIDIKTVDGMVKLVAYCNQ